MSPMSSKLSGLLLPVMLIALSACGHDPVRQTSGHGASKETVRSPSAASIQSPGQKAASAAVRQIGVPYRYGGENSDGFDCSGLAKYAYLQAGKRIPRTTSQQWQAMSPVARDRLEVGDLLFFEIDGSISHVGLYLGKRRFVHAPSSGREVSIASLDSAFYKKAFIRGGRPK